jgi:Uma2 family endonuclease
MSVVSPTTVVCDKEWTVRDLDRMPEGYRYEILDGVLYMTAMPSWPHGGVVDNLKDLISPWIRSRKLGRFLGAQNGIYHSETNYVDPDLIFVRPDQIPAEGERHRTAALAVEVLSPSNLRVAREERESLFARARVEEIWYVDTRERTLEVRRLEGDRYVTARTFVGSDNVTSAVFPGLEFPLSAAWEDLTP